MAWTNFLLLDTSAVDNTDTCTCIIKYAGKTKMYKLYNTAEQYKLSFQHTLPISNSRYVQDNILVVDQA